MEGAALFCAVAAAARLAGARKALRRWANDGHLIDPDNTELLHLYLRLRATQGRMRVLSQHTGDAHRDVGSNVLGDHTHAQLTTQHHMPYA